VRLLPWAALLLLGVANAQVPPQEEIRECLAGAGSSAENLEQLEQACPELGPALESIGIRPLIAATSREKITPASLPSVLVLNRESQREGPDVRRAAAALQGVADGPVSQSRWARLKAWLLERLTGNSSSAQWLSDWLTKHSPSAAMLKVVLYALFALVVVAAVVVVINEMRAAGFLRRRASHGSVVARVQHVTASGNLTLADIRDVPVPMRPALLFRLLVEGLIRTERLPADRSLTHRELRHRAQWSDESQRATWEQLALLAERQIFSGSTLRTDEIGTVLEDAERLHPLATEATGRTP
jgi:hypothetical protein